MGSADLRGDPAAKVNFPLYAIEMLTDRHFVVAGGGGAAKTGVSNGFVCFKILFYTKYWLKNITFHRQFTSWLLMENIVLQLKLENMTQEATQ